MQQLTLPTLISKAVVTEKAIEFMLPLPPTPLKTQQWVDEFCQRFDFTPAEADWGADRFQVTLSTPDLQCMLCMEWLCDAIWLEPIGTNQDTQRLYTYLCAQK